MRKPRARVALAQLGVELGAPRDDERVYQRRAGAEQSPAALGDAVAQCATPVRNRVELAHPPGDENATPALTEKSSRDDPGRAAVRRMPFRPPHHECAAAGAGADDAFGDAASRRDRVG